MNTTPQNADALFTVDYSYMDEQLGPISKDLYAGNEGGVEAALRSLSAHELAFSTVVEWDTPADAEPADHATAMDVKHYSAAEWLADRELHPLRGNVRPEVLAIEELARELHRRLADLAAINREQGLEIQSAGVNLDTMMRDLHGIRRQDLYAADDLRAHFAREHRRGSVNETAHYASNTEEGNR